MDALLLRTCAYFSTICWCSQSASQYYFWAESDDSRKGSAAPLQHYYSGAWLSAVVEDLVSASTTLDKDVYFFNELYGYSPIYSTDYLNADEGSTRYLKFVIQDFNEAEEYTCGERPELPSVYYGWMAYAYTAEDGLNIISSAIGLDHQNMIVGSGAIPEPTSGLLLLFGVAALALRRGPELMPERYCDLEDEEG